MNIKEEFHQLIDKIENEQLLKECYDLISKISYEHKSELWNKLTGAEQNELLSAYEENFEAKNVLTFEEAKNQHQKWLRL